MNNDKNGFNVEIHKAKEIVTLLNEIEGIVKILKIADVIKENMLERMKDIREILKEAKLKETK